MVLLVDATMGSNSQTFGSGAWSPSGACSTNTCLQRGQVLTSSSHVSQVTEVSGVSSIKSPIGTVFCPVTSLTTWCSLYASTWRSLTHAVK